jgi:hypothetical protein
MVKEQTHTPYVSVVDGYVKVQFMYKYSQMRLLLTPSQAKTLVSELTDCLAKI